MENISGKRILLHCCCGPCSLGAIEPLLSDGADITLFYYNPCIVPGEFELRLCALETVARHYGLPLVVPEQSYASFSAYAAPHASAPEGGTRCSLCICDRLKGAADYASAHTFDYYTTTLTVSPHKNSKLIFSLADAISSDVPFLHRDFKKRDGFLLSTRLSRELDIYRQKFCGCEFSKPHSSSMGYERSQSSGIKAGENE